jgi:GAF domain-containing protein
VVGVLGIRALVAVPVVVEGELWGILGAVSPDEVLPVGTEDRLSHFAEFAVGALLNAQTRGHLQRLAEEQAALLRVAQLVARGADENALFNAVAVEAAGLIGNEGTNLVRFDGPRTFTVIATSGGPAEVGLSLEVPPDDPGTAAEVIRTHRAARRDDYRLQSAPAFAGREYALGSSVSVPIIVEGQLWGLLGSLTEGRRLPQETESRLQQFAELVAGCHRQQPGASRGTAPGRRAVCAAPGGPTRGPRCARRRPVQRRGRGSVGPHQQRGNDACSI